jgi:hypothetical protein
MMNPKETLTVQVKPLPPPINPTSTSPSSWALAAGLASTAFASTFALPDGDWIRPTANYPGALNCVEVEASHFPSDGVASANNEIDARNAVLFLGVLAVLLLLGMLVRKAKPLMMNPLKPSSTEQPRCPRVNR